MDHEAFVEVSYFIMCHQLNCKGDLVTLHANDFMQPKPFLWTQVSTITKHWIEISENKNDTLRFFPEAKSTPYNIPGVLWLWVSEHWALLTDAEITVK